MLTHRIILLSFLLTPLGFAAPLHAEPLHAEPLHAAPASATRQMIATANPLASQAGLEILRQGGSAIDATIAAQMVLGLVEPQSAGIGGGAFLLHYDGAEGRVEAYDGRETAPMAADENLFMGADGEPLGFFEALIGGRAVGTPGLLRMLELAHREHGRLPWANLFAPAIALAEDGFLVSPRLSALLSAEDPADFTPSALGYFFGSGTGSDQLGLQEGQRVTNPAYAATLRLIATGGADAFYTGPLAEQIVAAVTTAPNPGLLSLSDLANYEAKERGALCRPYRSWVLCGMPPPTSGGVTVLQILGLLEGFDLPSMEPLSPEPMHLIAEASRLAFADRNLFLADPDFVEIPLAGLLDAGYLAQRASLIDPGASMGQAEPGLPSPLLPAPEGEEPPSTTHLSVVDQWGSVVSMTASIEYAFGARVMVGGFLLNNQLTDFSFVPTADDGPVANRVEAGKRPRSSMSPFIVLDQDGHAVMAVGSPGGSRIIGYVAQALIAHLDWGLDAQAALDLGHVVNRGGTTDLEEGTAAAELVVPLEALGHEVRLQTMTSGLHAVVISPEGLTGGADPRREGVALGD